MIKSYSFFVDKIKTKPYIKNSRHSSLHMNVFDPCLKFHFHNLNIEWDIHVQNISEKIGFKFKKY